VRLVADGHNLGFGIGDPAGVELLFADTVDNMRLWVSDSCFGERANDVHLVIFPGLVAGVDVHNVVRVVQPEHGIGPVPVNVVNFARLDC